MPCMILFSAKDKGRVLRGWDRVSVCGSSGSAQLWELPTSYILIRVNLYWTSTCTVHIYPSYVENHSPARGSGCQSGFSSLTSSILQSCSTFHPQPHRSVGFHNPSVVQSSWLWPCNHQNSCAQFCHGYYICSLRLPRSITITQPLLGRERRHRKEGFTLL